MFLGFYKSLCILGLNPDNSHFIILTLFLRLAKVFLHRPHLLFLQ